MQEILKDILLAFGAVIVVFVTALLIVTLILAIKAFAALRRFAKKAEYDYEKLSLKMSELSEKSFYGFGSVAGFVSAVYPIYRLIRSVLRKIIRRM